MNDVLLLMFTIASVGLLAMLIAIMLALPLGFFAFTADMAMLDNPPQSDTPAPAWLFVPDLGPALWYEPHGESNSGPQEYMPTAMFQLEPCPQR